MAEVYDFLECYIYRVGTASGDTAETAIDAYGEGVSVALSRELQERTDSTGVVQQRIPTKTTAEMTISKLYSDDPFLFDGNDIKLYMMNALGTQTYVMTGAWWGGKDWGAGAGDLVKFDVKVVGKSFGTV